MSGQYMELFIKAVFVENLALSFFLGMCTFLAVSKRIETAFGPVPIKTLRQGDMVHTMDHGFQPIRWIGSRKLSAEELRAHENLRPIRIRAGALGKNTPEIDLFVSPQHRVLVRSKIAKRVCGEDEVMVAAKHLVTIDGIEFVPEADEVEYFHFLFDRHEVVLSNGAATESLYTGPEALKSLPPEAREEIFTLFPELMDVDYRALACRTLANGRMGRKLAIRHKNNKKPLVVH